MPTTSLSPTDEPSLGPSQSAEPSSQPSSGPSLAPSTSLEPSAAPSEAPSLLPSGSPSDRPSASPTTFLNYMSIEYSFDVSYAPGGSDEVKEDLQQNVTESLLRIMDDQDSLLFPLVILYDLQLDENQDSWAYELPPDEGEHCVANALSCYCAPPYYLQSNILLLRQITPLLAAMSTQMIHQAMFAGDSSYVNTFSTIATLLKAL